MSEKKVVGRRVFIALEIVCIILLACLVGATSLYQWQINDKDNTITNLQSQINQFPTWLDGNKTLLDQTQTWLEGNITNYNSQISDLQNKIASLNSTYNNYVNDHSYTNEQYQNLQNQITSLNAQITSLQSQIANLQAPKLIEVNLKSDDNHPIFGTEYLHVYGEVCNVGTDTAYGSILHVVAYQSGDVVAINTYIWLGTISGESWKSIDASITYSGDSLTSWTITPEFPIII
jgi:chromosome segregation ATPase